MIELYSMLMDRIKGSVQNSLEGYYDRHLKKIRGDNGLKLYNYDNSQDEYTGSSIFTQNFSSQKFRQNYESYHF